MTHSIFIVISDLQSKITSIRMWMRSPGMAWFACLRLYR